MSDPFRPGRRAPETEVERAWNRLFADCRHPDMSGKKAVFQADVLLVLDALEQAQSELARLREAAALMLERYRRKSDSYRPEKEQDWPTEYGRGWHDGYGTMLATASLDLDKVVDPEGAAKAEEYWRDGFMLDDRAWFEQTGACGHCGNRAKFCVCTTDDPCGCGPHELDPSPTPCWRCGGTGEVNPFVLAALTPGEPR